MAANCNSVPRFNRDMPAALAGLPAVYPLPFSPSSPSSPSSSPSLSFPSSSPSPSIYSAIPFHLLRHPLPFTPPSPFFFVIPAKAGISQRRHHCEIPAFAGMTEIRAPGEIPIRQSGMRGGATFAGTTMLPASLPAVYPLPFRRDNAVFDDVEMIVSRCRHAGVNW